VSGQGGEHSCSVVLAHSPRRRSLPARRLRPFCRELLSLFGRQIVRTGDPLDHPLRNFLEAANHGVALGVELTPKEVIANEKARRWRRVKVIAATDSCARVRAFPVASCRTSR
jgi:hypothetical protein